MGNYMAECTNNRLIICLNQEHPSVLCMFRNHFFCPSEAVTTAGGRRDPRHDMEAAFWGAQWGLVTSIQNMSTWIEAWPGNEGAVLRCRVPSQAVEHLQHSELLFWMCWSPERVCSLWGPHFDADGGSVVFEMCSCGLFSHETFCYTSGAPYL